MVDTGVDLLSVCDMHGAAERRRGEERISDLHDHHTDSDSICKGILSTSTFGGDRSRAGVITVAKPSEVSSPSLR